MKDKDIIKRLQRWYLGDIDKIRGTENFSYFMYLTRKSWTITGITVFFPFAAYFALCFGNMNFGIHTLTDIINSGDLLLLFYSTAIPAYVELIFTDNKNSNTLFLILSIFIILGINLCLYLGVKQQGALVIAPASSSGVQENDTANIDWHRLFWNIFLTIESVISNTRICNKVNEHIFFLNPKTKVGGDNA